MNATQAYLSFYSKSTPEGARRSGSLILTKIDIKSEIQRIRSAAASVPGSAVLTLAAKFKFLASIIRTPVGNLTPDSPLTQEWTEKTTALATKTRIKMPCKLRALELHSRLAGHFDHAVPVSDHVVTVVIGQ